MTNATSPAHLRIRPMLTIARRCWPMIAIIAVAVGCGPNQLELRQVMKAETDYRNQNYDAAHEKLDKFLRRYPNDNASAEAYCLRALCRVQMSKKHLAENDARQCVKLASDRDLRANAHATLATLLYEAGKTNEAIEHYDAALKTLPEKPPADLLHYRYGLCLQRSGRWQDARLQFASVYQRYPTSEVAAHAKRFYEWPHNAYSIQAGAFRDSGSASELNQRLKRSALPSRVERTTRQGERLYNVYVGKYPQYDTAERMLATVRRVVADAFVVPK